MPEATKAYVSKKVNSLEEMNIPPALRESIDQHQKNLLGLAAALLAGGQGEAMVRDTVDSVFNSYKDELVKAIMVLTGEQT